jgi:branched-chain amino acid transport system ATP-binding protein
MKNFLHKKAGNLSGGQQQMVAFSRAILAKPKLLLLDEVTMGLSPKLVADVFDTIYNIGRNFSKIVITGQETERILGVSDRVYLMKTGHISECEKGKIKSEKIF